MKNTILICALLLSFSKIIGQEIINLSFYNLLNYPQAPPENREQILSLLIEEMQPDIFMICELESENGGIDILNNSLNVATNRFASAPYVNNTSSGADLQQLLYFDQNKFELTDTDIIQTSVRDINRYQLKFRTEEELFIEVFVSHLKASQGVENEMIRLEMVEEFTEYLDTLDPEIPLIFAGDLNLYFSDEPAYQELLDTSNNIVLVDPIDTPGNWNSNPNFATTHTQSTRISNDDFDDFGAGGGLDSRFDFILLSKDMTNSNSTITYIEDSYVAFGNNGNCYNERIDDNSCGGIFSSSTRNLLYQMSDHLPVLAQLNVDATFLPPLSLEDIAYWSINKTVVNDFIEINFTNTQPQVTINIYDQTGRLLINKPLQGQHISINVQSLSNGIYYVVSSNSNSSPIKFIKVS